MLLEMCDTSHCVKQLQVSENVPLELLESFTEMSTHVYPKQISGYSVSDSFLMSAC
jgi:hypothetical protein